MIGVNSRVSVCLSKASWHLPGISWAPRSPFCTKEPPQKGDNFLKEKKLICISQQDLISVQGIHGQGKSRDIYLLLLLGSSSQRNHRREGKRPRAHTDGRCHPLHSRRRACPAPCRQGTKVLACLIVTSYFSIHLCPDRIR